MTSAAAEEAEGSSAGGASVDQLMQTVVAIKGTPSLARFTFRARNRWIDGGHGRPAVREDYELVGEGGAGATAPAPDAEPAALVGEVRGANPVEFVLKALAGCLTTSLVYHAAAQGIKIDEVESHLEGDLDLQGFLGLRDDVRNGYENLRVIFRVKADAPEEKIRELCDLAQRRSPVFDIVANPVPVSVSVEKA